MVICKVSISEIECLIFLEMMRTDDTDDTDDTDVHSERGETSSYEYVDVSQNQ